MPGIYNGVKLEPIQSFNISEQLSYYDNGKLKVYLFNMTVTGKIVPSQTLPLQTRKDSILTAQQTMLNKFKNSTSLSENYFEIQPRSGSAPIKFIPRIKSVVFKEDTWVDFCEYTIEMEADEIWIGSVKVPLEEVKSSDSDESWSVEYSEEDPKFVKVNHKISCKSKAAKEKKGWEISKEIVMEKVGLLIPTNIKDSSKGIFRHPSNKKTSYTVNITGGDFTADISLVYHNELANSGILVQAPYAYHEQTYTDKEAAEKLRETLSIEGTITGLSPMDGGDRYAGAAGLWGTVKAQIEGIYSNYVTLSSSETNDKTKGVISYSYEIENRNKPSGLLSENIVITFMGALAGPPKVYVVHSTISGGLGPIFQFINTHKPNTLSITMDTVGGSDNPNTLLYKPANSNIESDSINFTAQTGRHSRTTVFMTADGVALVLPVITGYELKNSKIPRI